MTFRTLTAAFALTLSPLALRAEEVKLKKSDVPAAVLETVQKKYPKAKLTGFEKETKDGKTAYEIKLQDGKEKLEVALTPEGKITTEESEVKLEQVPEAVRKALAGSKYASWKARKAEKIVTDEDAAKLTYEIAVGKGKEKAEIVFDASGKILAE